MYYSMMKDGGITTLLREAVQRILQVNHEHGLLEPLLFPREAGVAAFGDRKVNLPITLTFLELVSIEMSHWNCFLFGMQPRFSANHKPSLHTVLTSQTQYFLGPCIRRLNRLHLDVS